MTFAESLCIFFEGFLTLQKLPLKLKINQIAFRAEGR